MQYLQFMQFLQYYMYCMQFCEYFSDFSSSIFFLYSDINECSSGTHNCSQVCVNNDGGFSCSCYEGYRLGNDRISCEGKGERERGNSVRNLSIFSLDIDECVEMTDNCEQTCTNTLGSYQCSCLSKWILRNGNNCTAAGQFHY